MDTKLKEQYVKALFRFRKSVMDFPKVFDINMTELFVMAGLDSKAFCDDNCVNMAAIQGHMHITKASISQMFKSIEKRGYIVRETDKSNRRKITVELTEDGRRVLYAAKKHTDRMLGEVLSRLGEENAFQLIKLLTKLSEIADEIKGEAVTDTN